MLERVGLPTSSIPFANHYRPGDVQLGFTDVLCFESGCQLLQSRLRFVLVLLDIVMPILVS